MRGRDNKAATKHGIAVAVALLQCAVVTLAPAQTRTGTDPSAKGETFMRLGSTEMQPTYSGIDAPLVAVRTASAVLSGEPTTWKVNNVTNFARQGKNVVCLSDRQGVNFIALVTPVEWVRLNTPEGIAHINSVLENFITLPQDLRDVAKLSHYVEYVAFLNKGPQRVVLSQRFLQGAERNLGVWLQGQEKDAQALRDLCQDPIVVVKEHFVEIQCNLVTSRGAVERWVLKGQIDGRLSISEITATELCGEGTFSYGMVGS